MDDARKSIIERLKSANNVLITVSRDPSVDQLAAMLGLALFLNKLNKHASAVFSGSVPDVIDFLEPGKTLEDNTDSLRDFIISLDKSKADKLRYKVEDEYVKIYVTPYRSSIREEDLNFSQGDFNIDAIVTIGVLDRDQLDDAITSHGRVLHDAAVLSISREQTHDFGTVSLVDSNASSYCEIVAVIANSIKETGFDEQISTAFMTGIVAETERFSNEKTVATTMAVSAKLLSAGANQQLVAENLAPKPEPVPEPLPDPGLPEQAWDQAPADGDGLPQAMGGSVHGLGIAPPVAEDGLISPDVLDQQDDFSLPPIQPDNSTTPPQIQPTPPVEEEPPKPNDGSLYISHDINLQEDDENGEEESQINQIHIDEQGMIRNVGGEDDLANVAPSELSINQPNQQAEPADDAVANDDFEPGRIDDSLEKDDIDTDETFSLPQQGAEQQMPAIIKPPAHAVLTQPPTQEGESGGLSDLASQPDSEDGDVSVDPLSAPAKTDNIPLLSHDSESSEAPAPDQAQRQSFDPMDFIQTEDSHFPSGDVATDSQPQGQTEQTEQQPTQVDPTPVAVPETPQPVAPPGESLLDLEAAVSDRPSEPDRMTDQGQASAIDQARSQVGKVAGDDNGPIIGLNSQPMNLGLPGEGPAFEEGSSAQDASSGLIQPTQQVVAPQQSEESRPPGFPPPLMPSQNLGQPQGPQPQNPMSY